MEMLKLGTPEGAGVGIVTRAALSRASADDDAAYCELAAANVDAWCTVDSAAG